jgi:leucyl-tRNA synthetase
VDIANVKFNTAIASLMKFSNAWQKSKLGRENAQKYLKLLAPFAPFLAEEIWHNVFEKEASIHLSDWPETEKILDKEVTITIPVTINHKVRALLQVATTMEKTEEQIKKLALQNNKVKKYLENKNYQTIYIKDKIINFIIK